MHFENAGRCKATHQGFAHLCRVCACLGSENQCFGNSLDIECDDDLVCNLGRLAITAIADERDVLAHELQERQSAVERFLRAASHDGEAGILRADLTARNRCIDIFATCRTDLLRKFLRLDGGNRAHVDEQLAFAKATDRATLAENNFGYLRRVRQHEDNGVALFGNSLRRFQNLQTVVDQLLAWWRIEPGGEELMSRILQMTRHRRAHDPQSDEAYLGHVAYSLIKFMQSAVLYAVSRSASWFLNQPRPSSVVVFGLYSQPIQPLYPAFFSASNTFG